MEGLLSTEPTPSSFLSCQEKFVRLLCPVNPVGGKIVNRFLSSIFAKRKYLDENLIFSRPGSIEYITRAGVKGL